MVTAYLQEHIARAIQQQFSISLDPAEIQISIPRPEHGDYATNVAIVLARQLQKAPREIAQHIIAVLSLPEEEVLDISIAGAGFINFRFSPYFYHKLLFQMLQHGEQWGKLDIGRGKTANVEFVSANPTGPLHVGHGRNAAIGDTLANLYEWLGYTVTREYYFNNAGNQMKLLARSIYARYRQLLGDTEFPFPEDGYHGEYIWSIAQHMYQQYGDTLREETAENLSLFQKEGEQWCFRLIRETLAKMGITFDVYFNEDSLYQDGSVQNVIEQLREKGLVYEKDGALWLRLTQLGRPTDRVIVKSSGEPTYRLPDIAYHQTKFERGFDVIIDVLGADHVETVEDVKAALAALGYDIGKIRVVLHQFVTLLENGTPVKMSKRSGKSYTLDMLIEELGADVVRFFFVMRGVSKHLDFDLDLARDQSEKNPVYYLQYAHARICSIFRKLDGQQWGHANDVSSLSVLKEPEELALIKSCARFPEILHTAVQLNEPVVLVDFLREVAAAFHRFYHHYPVLAAEDPLKNARLALLRVVQTTIRNGLAITGVSAPEQM